MTMLFNVPVQSRHIQLHTHTHSTLHGVCEERKKELGGGFSSCHSLIRGLDGQSSRGILDEHDSHDDEA